MEGRLFAKGTPQLKRDCPDHQRKFITERLETLREKLNDYRARESAQVEKLELARRVVEWTERIGDGLDNLPQEERREVLRLFWTEPPLTETTGST